MPARIEQPRLGEPWKGFDPDFRIAQSLSLRWRAAMPAAVRNTPA